MIHFGTTQLGAKHLNKPAKDKKDVFSRALAGMECKQCHGDSYINFVLAENGTRVRVQTEYCCADFEQKANEQLRRQLL